MVRAKWPLVLVLHRNILTFHKYDTDGSGQLDSDEFAAALRDLGYPATWISEFQRLEITWQEPCAAHMHAM